MHLAKSVKTHKKKLVHFTPLLLMWLFLDHSSYRRRQKHQWVAYLKLDNMEQSEITWNERWRVWIIWTLLGSIWWQLAPMPRANGTDQTGNSHFTVRKITKSSLPKKAPVRSEVWVYFYGWELNSPAMVQTPETPSHQSGSRLSSKSRLPYRTYPAKILSPFLPTAP